MTLDGHQMRLLGQLAPEGCPREQNVLALALLAGAAAGAAARLSDRLDCGQGTDGQLLSWGVISSFLMELADYATPDPPDFGERIYSHLADLLALDRMRNR